MLSKWLIRWTEQDPEENLGVHHNNQFHMSPADINWNMVAHVYVWLIDTPPEVGINRLININMYIIYIYKYK